MWSRQDVALAIAPKVGSSLSIPASIFIIFEAISDHRKGKGTAIQRTLVGMSIVDVLASLAWFLSTWLVPEGTAPFARGNLASCNFQGFLLQLAIGAPLYNCSLALYYVLVIRFNWTNDRLIRIERYVHAFIITFTVGTSIAGLPLTMYNQVGNVCWVIGSPAECENSSASPSDIPCDRGNWAWLFGILLFYGPIWVCVFLTIIAMFVIYFKVQQTYQKSTRYGSVRFSMQGSSMLQSEPEPNRSRFWCCQKPEPGDSNRESSLQESGIQESGISLGRASRTSDGSVDLSRARERFVSRRRNKERMFATQAILYSGSFFITWMPSTIWSICHWFNVSSFYIDLFAAICEPLQGFWNMLIFIRRRQSSQKKLKSIFSTLFCVNICKGWCSNTKPQEAEMETSELGDSVSTEQGPSRSSKEFTKELRFQLDEDQEKK